MEGLFSANPHANDHWAGLQDSALPPPNSGIEARARTCKPSKCFDAGGQADDFAHAAPDAFGAAASCRPLLIRPARRQAGRAWGARPSTDGKNGNGTDSFGSLAARSFRCPMQAAAFPMQESRDAGERPPLRPIRRDVPRKARQHLTRPVRGFARLLGPRSVRLDYRFAQIGARECSAHEL